MPTKKAPKSLPPWLKEEVPAKKGKPAPAKKPAKKSPAKKC
jgi:hypothetical protein